jgi:hypothetical protein
MLNNSILPRNPYQTPWYFCTASSLESHVSDANFGLLNSHPSVDFNTFGPRLRLQRPIYCTRGTPKSGSQMAHPFAPTWSNNVFSSMCFIPGPPGRTTDDQVKLRVGTLSSTVWSQTAVMGDILPGTSYRC